MRPRDVIRNLFECARTFGSHSLFGPLAKRLSSPNVNEEIDCRRDDLDFIKLGTGRRFGTLHLARKGGKTCSRSPRRFQSNEYAFSLRPLICWTRIGNRVDRFDPNTKRKQLQILILRQKQQPVIKKKKMKKKNSEKKHSQTRRNGCRK